MNSNLCFQGESEYRYFSINETQKSFSINEGGMFISELTCRNMSLTEILRV